MGYGYWDHMNGWGVAAAGVGSVLLWTTLVLAALALLQHLRRPSGRPEELLRERYARGEIDEGEYRRRLETLRGTDGHADLPGR